MQRSPELEDLVAAWFAAATAGDASLVDAHVSRRPGARLIGSDPEEWFRGGDAIATFLRGEVDGAGGQVTFIPSNVEAFEEGTVGWATTTLTITRADGKQIAPRWSAVFHREDGAWKIVQTHASIAVRNEDVGWVYA
jgi:ketosteroid isomerase-like protein